MIILGLNAFHGDSSAALVRDGTLIAAVEEERFRRIKHWAGFPTRAIDYCIRDAGLGLADVNHIAINQNSRSHLSRKVLYALRSQPRLGLVWDRLRNRRARRDVETLLAESFPQTSFKGMVHHIDHHFAHLSSAFHVSPFKDAVVASIDGFGDFSSAAWGIGQGNDIREDGRIFFPHSLGLFYQALTQYLGFPNYGDEYKVMGLAPYGQASEMDAMREIVHAREDGRFALNLAFFRHHLEPIAYQWSDGAPQYTDLFSSRLELLLGPRRNPGEPLNNRHRDIASSVQAMYEEAFLSLIGKLQKDTGLTNLALAGGCAMNSVANGKVCRATPFRRVYVQAAAGDAGGAIGAAFAVWHKMGGARRFVMDHAYWGPQFDDEQIDSLVQANRHSIEAAGCTIQKLDNSKDLCECTAREIADGKIVGWFQGRMEWGPRALGNRSILCDPRRADMKSILNAKIKRRESFRPFAPSVLEGAVEEWFEENGSVPFMMQVFQIRENKRALIPAVTHIDGSGRLQTVSSQANPLYHFLIAEFAKLTGIPMVLNTSFNENEPVVCEPQEALDCFLRTNMDVLVLSDIVIMRQSER